MDPICVGILSSIQDSIALKQALLCCDEYLQAVAAAGQVMARALAAEKKLFFFGNGGSAADAQHLAAELNGRLNRERPGLAAWALTCNTSSLTAIANDYGYEMVFARQLQAIGTAGDVAIAVSTSGNSPNVLKAIETARERQLITIGLTGSTGGRLSPVVDHCIRIPSEQTQRIQEAHIMTGHILCDLVEQELFGRAR